MKSAGVCLEVTGLNAVRAEKAPDDTGNYKDPDSNLRPEK